MHAGPAALRILTPLLLGLGSFGPIATASASDLAPDEVHAVYTSAGLVPSTPTYSTAGIATFSVDVPGERNPAHPALRVFVYTDTASADAEHRLAHAREEARRTATLQYSDDVGPQLLLGYGPSLWRQNVALVQIAPIDDTGAHAQEIECGADGIAITPPPRTSVTSGFQAPLEALVDGAPR